MEIIYLLVWSLIWGVVCQAVGNSKNVKGFWWGFFLGFFGLIVVLCTKNKPAEELNIEKTKSETQTAKYEQLEKIAKLKESGAISDEEFETEKKKLLK